MDIMSHPSMYVLCTHIRKYLFESNSWFTHEFERKLRTLENSYYDKRITKNCFLSFSLLMIFMKFKTFWAKAYVPRE